MQPGLGFRLGLRARFCRSQSPSNCRICRILPAHTLGKNAFYFHKFVCLHLQPLHGQFLQPYRNADCPKHTTCLSCMTNAACGWCSTSCVSRSSSVSFCVDNEGNQKMLTLNASECTVCLDHMDCSSCNQVIIQAPFQFQVTCFWV